MSRNIAAGGYLVLNASSNSETAFSGRLLMGVLITSQQMNAINAAQVLCLSAVFTMSESMVW